MDGSVYEKKLSQLHGNSFLWDSDKIFLRAAGLHGNKSVMLFFTLLVWISFLFFPFRCSLESLPKLQPESQHCPCTLFCWNESLRNISEKEWNDLAFAGWIMQQCLNEMIGNQLCYCECVLWTVKLSADRDPGLFLRLTSLKSFRRKISPRWFGVPVFFSLLDHWAFGAGEGRGWPVNYNPVMVALPNQAETVTVTFGLFCCDLMQGRLNSLHPHLLLSAFSKKTSVQLKSLQEGTDGSNFSKHLPVNIVFINYIIQFLCTNVKVVHF